MDMFKSTAKLSVFALSLSMMTSGCALADFVKNGQSVQLHGVDVSHLSPEEKQKLEEEIKLDQARLAQEKQAILEMSLTHEIGEHALQFKPLLARLYAERKYTPLWKDNAAARQLLQGYAAMVASGISKRSAKSSDNVGNSNVL